MSNRCVHCGAKLQKHTHSMSPVLANILVDMARAVRLSGVNKFHVHKDVILKAPDYKRKSYQGNYHKLAYFGLIAKYRENGKHVQGYWQITLRGGEFLRGEATVPKTVTTFRGVLDHEEVDPEHVTIKMALKDPEYVHDLQYYILNSKKVEPEFARQESMI